MSMLKFISFTDVHISMNNPSSRKGDYAQDILDKLKQIGDLGRQHKVDFFLFGGDLFNLKAPMRNSHELNSLLINLFRSYPARVYATEGNHDLRSDSYETFQEQPLHVIYASGALTQARDEVKKSKGFKYRIRSFPFDETPDLTSYPKAKRDVDLNICLLHLYSTPDGGMLFKSKLYSYEEIGILEDDIFLMGHYHKDQGIDLREKDGRKQVFINVGSVSRGTMAEEDVKRAPKVALVTVTKGEGGIEYQTEEITLDVKPPEEVFNLEVREKEKKEAKEAEKFVAKLETELNDVSEMDDISKEIPKLDTDQKVIDKVKYFLEEAHLQGKNK